MHAALKEMTKVLPGKRIEFTSPELTEGEEVELIVLTANKRNDGARQFSNVLEFLDSLTPIERTPEEWAEVEREFHEERNSWGDRCFQQAAQCKPTHRSSSTRLKGNSHLSPVPLTVRGDYECRASLTFLEVTDQMRRTHGDPEVATERGACALAILIIRCIANTGNRGHCRIQPAGG